MPFCTECGRSYQDEARFCPHCGNPNALTKNIEQEIDNAHKLRKSTELGQSGQYGMSEDLEIRRKTNVSDGGSYGLDIYNLENGTKLENGKFTIIKKLGQGGFGVVYQASDENFNGKLKALKIINNEHYSDRLLIDKLKNEAIKMIDINDSNVVRLYSLYLDGNIKFFDMEFVDGGDLVDLMLKYRDYKVPEEKVWELIPQIAQGMQAIHETKIFHLDLKPENILLTSSGRVKITDFGISETNKSSKSRIKKTEEKGTYNFASPEQLDGDEVGRESDIWSFGVTLYHILTGKTLYSGKSSSDVITQIERRVLKPIIGVSDKMNALLAKCLKRDYKERFRDFGEVLEFVKTDYSLSIFDSFDYLLDLAVKGDKDAQYKLGDKYYYGSGVEEDEAEAVKWYRKAAKQGNKKALVALKNIQEIVKRDSLNKTKIEIIPKSGNDSFLNLANLSNGSKFINERYTILEKLGASGFGVVYKASDANYDGELKALKVIYIENYSDRLVMHKLKTEAENMIKINHPNVVRLYDLHFDGEIKFLDMEFVDGSDLAVLMKQYPRYRIPEEKVCELVPQIVHGMQAIHEKNILHLSLKPENILLTSSGRIKITDFGFSENFMEGPTVYASPEQLIGRNIGKETDIWSFGVTLYHLLTGETLYSVTQSSDILTQINNQEFKPISGVSDKMNTLLAKCLKKDYKERFRDFGEVLEYIKLSKLDKYISSSSSKVEEINNSSKQKTNSLYETKFKSKKKIPWIHSGEYYVEKFKLKLYWIGLFIGLIILLYLLSFLKVDIYNCLGDGYLYGKCLISQNQEKAYQWYRKSAENGDVYAQNNLGWMYYNGNGVDKDYTEAVKWFRKAADQGSAYAQNYLGSMYWNGYGVDKDYTQAVKWYRKSAEQGYAIAQDNLGLMFCNGYGIDKDYTQAIKWYRKSAEQGDASAQNNLGWMYENGYGVDKDYTEAVKWYQKSAEQGNAFAQNNLGLLYKNGYGVDKDYSEAVKWYRKSAEQGNAYAQYNLGFMYHNGYGVDKDYSEAIKWFRKSAEQGNASAQNNLGWMYWNGYGVDKDYTEAVKWYQKSAKQGNASAQYNLGVMYENGYGVDKDDAEAVKWYKRSAELGDKDAIKILEKKRISID